MVERNAFNIVVVGSNPTGFPVTVAQSAERMAFNHVAVGSSPTRDIRLVGVSNSVRKVLIVIVRSILD